MGEIDTKSIESVQAALSLFGEKGDQKKCRSTSKDHELEKERDFECLQKDVANYKMELETKDSTYIQTVVKLEYYQKTTEELTNLLKNSEVERDGYIDECREARSRIYEFESKMMEIDVKLSESIRICDELSHVINDLEAELVVAKELKFEAEKRAEDLENGIKMEKEKSEALLKLEEELNQALFVAKKAVSEAENDKLSALLEKDAEIELVTMGAIRVQEELEDMRKELERMSDLENQLMAKSLVIDSLQLELEQTNEIHSLCPKAASGCSEMELNELKLELQNAKEAADRLKCTFEMLSGDLLKAKIEVDETRVRESEALVEIALLKSELHKGRSKIAAAEAAEARAKSMKSGLYLAVQHLAVEAEEAKKETQRLKQLADETESTENASTDAEDIRFDDSKSELEEQSVDIDTHIDTHITISLSEYENLSGKAERYDQISGPASENEELEAMNKELEISTVKIREFRTRAEQAMSRAEAAERAKAAVEDQLRLYREQRQRRKAALAVLREEYTPKPKPVIAEKPPTPYQPLGKVLNMKF